MLFTKIMFGVRFGVNTVQPRVLIRVVCSLGLSAIVAGCATDGGSSQSIPNPFAGSARFDPNATGSISQKAPQAQQSAAVDVLPVDAQGSKSIISSEPLASPVALAPAKQNTQVISEPMRVAAVQPQKSVVASSTASASKTVTATGIGYWTPEGGSQVILTDGETIKTISDRYGVPVSAIRTANKLSAKAVPKAGTRLIIPVYRDGASLSSGSKAEKSEPVSAVVPKISTTKKTAEKVDQPSEVAAVAKTTSTDASEPLGSSAPASSDATKTNNAAPAAKAAIESVGFRWPAKGRVIAGFGNVNGTKNTGIKIALPVGTSVKASEAGTVAYSGSEVKGYGNMIIIRHPDGWVSVYANNGDLKVKRGDQVTRGQVVALSGQSGDVSSPQLHFELRKGSSPVDPMGYFSEN